MLLSVYWASFATWLIRRLERRWRRAELGERLRATALDVGEALVAARHGDRGAVVLHLDRLAWITAVASSSGWLEAHEVRRIEEVVRTTRGMIGCPPS